LLWTAASPWTAALAAPPANYRLQPDDELQVSLLELSRTNVPARVQPDGKIQLPLLGEVQAEGRTLGELRQILLLGYAQRYKNPHLMLNVTRFGNLNVYVTGQVGRPGAVTLVAGLSAVRAVAEAGGLLPNARSQDAVVLRHLDTDHPSTQRVRIGEVLGGQTPDIPLQPGDVVYVPKGELRVFVGGEVVQPGVLTIEPSTTALAAITQAGGLTSLASAKSAFLLRDNKDGTARLIPLPLDQALAGAASPRLEPYDIIVVPRSGIAKVNLAVDQYVRKLLPFSLDFGFSYFVGVIQ
jgi:polysaccharide export outer membrane protein